MKPTKHGMLSALVALVNHQIIQGNRQLEALGRIEQLLRGRNPRGAAADGARREVGALAAGRVPLPAWLGRFVETPGGDYSPSDRVRPAPGRPDYRGGKSGNKPTRKRD